MGNVFYADIILPLSVGNLFTYRVSSPLSGRIERGSGVIVPFGKKSSYKGIVYRIYAEKPDLSVVKEIIDVIGTGPLVSEVQLDLWQWVSEYYQCALGDVMNATLPSCIISADDSLKYRIRTGSRLVLSRSYTEDELAVLLDSMQKTPARYRLLINYLDITSYEGGKNVPDVSLKMLREKAGISVSVIKKLTEAGIFRRFEKEESRFDGYAEALSPLKELSPLQQKAYKEITRQFADRDTVLLHGVTSSGKTEIYIHLIEKVLSQGKKVLYLLPEIALTTQIINRLRKCFGDLVGVYHSGLNDNEKAEVYERIRGRSALPEYRVLLGVRSSVFLPVENAGLVIVDEEHDSSYKQYDPAPRYNARDTAVMKAKMTGAKVLMGSATPSVESMYNARTGKYGYAFLGQRYGDIKMPEIILADSKEAYRKKTMISHFTPLLIESIDQALEDNEQVVLFRNRRGFAHFIICADCGWTPVCPNCSVNYTYHKNMNSLYCHYCGSTAPVPSRCDNCKSTNLKFKGFGTEKVEDEISILFPDARVRRMDYDSTRKKGSMERIISELEKKETDILIGTQMISKGLDIENLTVVGILNLDGMLFYPDFRAHERCYQMAAQVSGRAGRRNTRGKVIIQTSDPYHPVMKYILYNDYEGMYNKQIEEREEFNYPPFSRLIRIYIKHKDRAIVDEAASLLADGLRRKLKNRVLGPEYPPHTRIQNLYIKSILLKTEKTISYRYMKELIGKHVNSLRENRKYSSVRIYSDVDPQ